MRLTAVRARLTGRTATFLLILRGLGGGALALAHAAEAPTAPAALDTSHHVNCVVVHDALRCAVCHVVAIRISPIAPHVVPGTDSLRAPRPTTADTVPGHGGRTRDAPPRAPPTLLG